jgi:hypothetical protein
LFRVLDHRGDLLPVHRQRIGITSHFHYVERRTNDRVGVDPEVPV